MSGYTIGEIVVWLLLAAVLGFVLGWLVRELQHRSQPAAAAPAGADAIAAGIDDSGAAAAQKAPAQRAAAKKTVVGSAPVKKATVKKAATKAPAKKAPTKAPAKKSAAKKSPAKKSAAKKAPAKKAAAITPGRFPRSARPLAGGRAPSAAYKIKGNEDSMIYHSPESPSYARTIAETWFKTEADAVAAGFRKPRNM